LSLTLASLGVLRAQEQFDPSRPIAPTRKEECDALYSAWLARKQHLLKVRNACNQGVLDRGSSYYTRSDVGCRRCWPWRSGCGADVFSQFRECLSVDEQFACADKRMWEETEQCRRGPTPSGGGGPPS
jgi:hypothetical protein